MKINELFLHSYFELPPVGIGVELRSKKFLNIEVVV